MELVERFDRYELEANTNREELKELTQQVAAIKAENDSLRRFVTGRLFKIYEVLNTRDVETTAVVRNLLTMQHEDQAINQRHLETTTRLEALLSRQPLGAALPASTPPNEHDPNAQGTESGELAADIAASTNKRGTSSRPEDVESAAKRQKV
jgi:hypothetical protein